MASSVMVDKVVEVEAIMVGLVDMVLKLVGMVTVWWYAMVVARQDTSDGIV